MVALWWLLTSFDCPTHVQVSSVQKLFRSLPDKPYSQNRAPYSLFFDVNYRAPTVIHVKSALLSVFYCCLLLPRIQTRLQVKFFKINTLLGYSLRMRTNTNLKRIQSPKFRGQTWPMSYLCSNHQASFISLIYLYLVVKSQIVIFTGSGTFSDREYAF